MVHEVDVAATVAAGVTAGVDLVGGAEEKGVWVYWLANMGEQPATYPVAGEQAPPRPAQPEQVAPTSQASQRVLVRMGHRCVSK